MCRDPEGSCQALRLVQHMPSPGWKRLEMGAVHAILVVVHQRRLTPSIPRVRCGSPVGSAQSMLVANVAGLCRRGRGRGPVLQSFDAIDGVVQVTTGAEPSTTRLIVARDGPGYSRSASWNRRAGWETRRGHCWDDSVASCPSASSRGRGRWNPSPPLFTGERSDPRAGHWMLGSDAVGYDPMRNTGFVCGGTGPRSMGNEWCDGR